MLEKTTDFIDCLGDVEEAKVDTDIILCTYRYILEEGATSRFIVIVIHGGYAVSSPPGRERDVL